MISSYLFLVFQERIIMERKDFLNASHTRGPSWKRRGELHRAGRGAEDRNERGRFEAQVLKGCLSRRGNGATANRGTQHQTFVRGHNFILSPAGHRRPGKKASFANSKSRCQSSSWLPRVQSTWQERSRHRMARKHG